jgi:SAM-dependent methyltransferase
MPATLMAAKFTRTGGILNSVDYYDHNAAVFVEQTLNVDMSGSYGKFLRLLPAGGSVLDAGSGSGRDAAYFISQGYKVEAFDASAEMVAATQQNAGIPAIQMSFEEFAWGHQFDGIWACASLLHVKRTLLPDVMQRMAKTLKDGGAMYASFKLGNEERIKAGRFFNDMDETALTNVLDEVAVLALEQAWVSSDVRPERAAELWLNCILVKRGDA